MKASWCRAAIMAFVFTVSLSPATALGPKLSGGNYWTTIVVSKTGVGSYFLFITSNFG
jgi:hypothetical protein